MWSLLKGKDTPYRSKVKQLGNRSSPKTLIGLRLILRQDHPLHIHGFLTPANSSTYDKRPLRFGETPGFEYAVGATGRNPPRLRHSLHRHHPPPVPVLGLRADTHRQGVCLAELWFEGRLLPPAADQHPQATQGKERVNAAIRGETGLSCGSACRGSRSRTLSQANKPKPVSVGPCLQREAHPQLPCMQCSPCRATDLPACGGRPAGPRIARTSKEGRPFSIRSCQKPTNPDQDRSSAPLGTTLPGSLSNGLLRLFGDADSALRRTMVSPQLLEQLALI